MASANHCAVLRFYGDLNDLLPYERRSVAFVHTFELHPSIKDLIESVGVPHPEVELILVEGVPVDFNYLVRDGDRISVYPSVTSSGVSSLLQLRQPLSEFRFILDIHLGKLAAYLRLLGFDSLYGNNVEDSTLARVSHDENRVLLTRDTGLLKRTEVVYGYFVRATEPMRQAIEVLKRFDLFRAAAPFGRCLRCNSTLEPISKESILERLRPKTRECFDEFRTCPSCNRIYWQGSHYNDMQRLIQRIFRGEQKR